MTGTLDGKTALVTGAGRGIGRAIARRLAADGAFVAVNYAASEAKARSLVEEIEGAGGRAFAVQADVADLAAIERMFAVLAERFDALDILVNNAGRGSQGLPLLESCTPENYDQMFGLNTRGLFFTTQAAVRMMRDGGRIVNFSSTSTLARVPGLSAYAGSEAAVEAFTRIWAAELAKRGILVTCVLPGMVDTDLISNNMPPDARERAARAHPLGRIGQPDDLADVVAFLCSNDARWINGEKIVANGGQ